MKKSLLTLLSAVALVVGHTVQAANLFFDINGTTAGSGTANNGSYTWEGNFWATGSAGTLATGAWSEGNFPEFSAGADNTTGSYTVTAGSPHTIVGTLQRTSTGTVTVAGAALTIDTTGGVTPAQAAGGPQQGFFSSGITKFTAKLTGVGGISSQSGQIALDNAANDYQGGTTVNGGLVNFNGACFGSSNIFVRANGGALIAEATGLTVPNNLNVIGGTAMNLSATANNFSTTYNGNFDLGGITEAIGVGGGTGCTVTINGIVSNGGVGRQVSTTHGTLVLAGPNTYAGKTTIDSSVTKVTSLNRVSGGSASSSLGHPITVVNGTIGFGSLATSGTAATGTLLYVGTGETTDRAVDLQGTSGGATFDQSGTGLLKFTSSMTASGVGTKNVTFQGSTAGTGEYAGTIVDNGTSGTTVTTAAAAINATSLTLGSLDGVVVGATISGTSIPAGTTILGLTNSTMKVTLSAQISAAISSGATVTIPNVKNRTYVLHSGTGTWTLSGANTYTGNTTNLSSGNNGVLNFANVAALGFGSYVQGANSSFDNTSGSAMTMTNGFIFSGGSPTFIGTSDMTISGPVTIAGATRTITVNANKLTIGNGIGQDASARALTKAGNGTLVLQGTSSYAGVTTINAGKLQVDGSIAASSGVTVAAAGTLGGNGVVPAVTVNGTISPGASPGTLTTGADTLAGGGSYVWEINDFNGSIGSAYDTINAASANITATTGSKFNIKVTSLSGTSAGLADNFDGNTDYDFTILHTTGGITGNGVAAINVDTTAFQNTLGTAGFFFVTIANGGNDLVLSYRRAASITSSPAAATLSAGSTANFSGSAVASGTVSYQWQKGGVNLSNGTQAGGSVVAGATTGALTVSGVGYLDEGAYTLVATGTYGPSATSSAAGLTVTDPPVVTSPTVDSTVAKDAGRNLVLTVTQTGRVGTYQWKKGAGNLSNGTYDNGATISGATTANLTLTGVRASDAGVYSAALTTTDGNATSANTTLLVNDPVITVQPANSTFECSSSGSLAVTAVGSTNADHVLTYQWYTPDPSGTAITDATNSSLSFPTVSFANAGSYSVVVSNTFGNSITSSVAVVTVADTTAPVITVNGGAATAECHTSYTDAGATATDACIGSVTVTTSGLPDVNTTGDYTVTYSATDGANTSTATRVVTIQDTTAPTLSLLGSAELTISCGTPYTDAGATANDSCAGDRTSSIVVNYGGLTPGNPTGGDYTITYNVQDPAGNAATQVTRLVHVVDSTAPVITVTGASSVTVECHGSYTDAGATATDNCAGTVTPTTTGSVDANTVGTYVLTYSATDGVNTSTATRTVHVTDTVAPLITLNGAASVTNECHTTYSDPSASATDDCDAGASVVASGTVDLDTVGVYTRTYTATDASGNHSSTTRQITVSDTIAPVITVTASASTVECHTSYTDAGATAADACDATPNVASAGSVDVNVRGDYTITYTATDATGNSSTATRTISVVDGTAPVVSLTGAASVTVECHGSFSDPGATATDTCDASPSVTPSGAVDVNTPGVYTLTYTATDAAGNTSSATRTVTVSDNSAPVLALNGAASVNVECHGSFSDPGATANDACEGAVSVNVTGSVDANTPGDYTLTYAACDSGSHCASITRVVHVTDSIAPVVTLTGDASVTVECHGSFTDAGATAADDCDAAPNVVTSGSVNANVNGTYTLTYTATDATGNSSSATRTVTVSDSAAPVVTVTGGDQTIECHSTFTDAGATANDACAGDVTANITVSGGVNANAVGVYVLTYSVNDGNGNSAGATRTVTVQDTVAPVITVTGNNPESACQFTSYSDAGATALDDCTGSVSVSSSGTVDINTAGAYTITYTAQDATGNTASATRVVNVAPCNAVITQQPQDTNVNANASFTLSVTAVSGNPITYQWSKNGTNIVGATDATFTIAHAFRTNAGTYTVDVTSGAATITSTNAVVTVNDPAFTINPVSTTVSAGMDKTLTLLAVADGTPTLKYQWYFHTTARTTKLTTSTNLLINVTTGAAGSYYCVVTNVGHLISATSAVAVVTVYQAPKFTKQPAPNNSRFVGQTLILSAGAGPTQANDVRYGGPIHYQWVRGNPDSYYLLTDDARHVGTTTATLTILNINSADQALLGDLAAYRCLATNMAPTNVFSHAALLTVKDYTNPPVVAILKAANNALITGSSNILMSGTATDKGYVTSVSLTQKTVEGTTNMDSEVTYKQTASHQPVPGSVLWTNEVALVPGTNAFTAFAVNAEGTIGTNKPVRNVFYLVPQALTVATNGSGTIQITSLGTLGKPIIGTTNVNQGIGYTLKAVPKSPHTFNNWTDENGTPYTGDGASSTSTTLHFIMPGTNMTIRANFN